MGKSADNIAVTDLRIEGTNINKLLAKIAYKYDVPISLEVATDEDLLNSNSLTVQLKKGTLADVFDDIVKQKPSYRWEASDRTIKVFPKSDRLQMGWEELPVSRDLERLNPARTPATPLPV